MGSVPANVIKPERSWTRARCELFISRPVRTFRLVRGQAAVMIAARAIMRLIGYFAIGCER